MSLTTSACLLIAAGCVRTPAVAPPSVPAAKMAATTTDYLGSDACRECHSTEFQQHRVSRHNRTLRPLKAETLGRAAPPAGHVAGSDIVFEREAGGYRLAMVGNESASAPVQLVFGSGKTGMTFAAFQQGGDMVEISRSWFPSRHLWYVTPGHEARPPEEVGLRCTPEEARRCLRCHGVPDSSATLLPERRLQGVGCETCHGPARAHVEAMRAGKMSDIKLARLGSLGGAESVKLCSTCHRGQDAVKMGTEQEHMTNRFQAFGLTQSRCFRESRDKLSCVTCHNPHADAATDNKAYEKICLSCHSGAAPTAKIEPGKICPVNRTSKCVECHMPTRAVFRSSIAPVSMAEHFIRVYERPAGSFHGSR